MSWKRAMKRVIPSTGTSTMALAWSIPDCGLALAWLSILTAMSLRSSRSASSTGRPLIGEVGRGRVVVVAREVWWSAAAVVVVVESDALAGGSRGFGRGGAGRDEDCQNKKGATHERRMLRPYVDSGGIRATRSGPVEAATDRQDGESPRAADRRRLPVLSRRRSN